MELNKLVKLLSNSTTGPVVRVLFGPDKQKYLNVIQNELTSVEWIVFEAYYQTDNKGFRSVKAISAMLNLPEKEIYAMLIDVRERAIGHARKTSQYKHYKFGIDSNNVDKEYEYLNALYQRLQHSKRKFKSKPRLSTKLDFDVDFPQDVKTACYVNEHSKLCRMWNPRFNVVNPQFVLINNNENRYFWTIHGKVQQLTPEQALSMVN